MKPAQRLFLVILAASSIPALALLWVRAQERDDQRALVDLRIAINDCQYYTRGPERSDRVEQVMTRWLQEHSSYSGAEMLRDALVKMKSDPASVRAFHCGKVEDIAKAIVAKP